MRFAAVGVGASFAYIAFAVGAVELHLIESRLAAVLLGVVAGFCVSYFGHHGFTYRRRARHGRYLPRFIGAQAAICVLMTALVFLLSTAGVPYWAANAAIVVLWPLTNLVVSELWVFYENEERSEMA